MKSGTGFAWNFDTNSPTPLNLSDSRRLAIASLGTLREHPAVVSLRQFLEGWYLSYFTPDAARTLPLAGAQRHLNMHGDNIGNVVEFMRREHPDKFQHILKRIADRIPGIRSIDTKKTDDGRLLLRFNDSAFRDPFYAKQVSDGTLKLFAYLLLLEDPEPAPFICIEEPENGLYHKLLEVLANELRAHSDRSQVFVTTHQPYFINGLTPEEVWIIEKQPDGFAKVRRASDDPIVKNMASEGIPLGSLWYSDYLDKQ
ncbi:MAG: AAA family ATPase [Bryobacteraceae bacterium]